MQAKKSSSQEMLTRNKLEEEYVKNRLSIRKISIKYGVDRHIISDKLKEYNIKIRGSGIKLDLTYEFLYNEYVNNHKTLKQISEISNRGIETIRRTLRKFDIKIRKYSDYQPIRQPLTKEFLQNEYINNNKSAAQIARETGYSDGMVNRRIKNYNIPRHDIKYVKEDLTGKKFGRLTVLGLSRHPNSKEVRWICQCSCNNKNTVNIQSHNLTKDNGTKSCGCLKIDKTKERLSKGVGEITGWYFSSLRCGANIRNIKFDLTIEFLWDLFIKQNRKCAYSGIKLKFAKRGKTKDTKIGEQTASVDRINPTRGYTEDNVHWTHKDINLMKHAISDSKFLALCFAVSKYREKEYEEFCNDSGYWCDLLYAHGLLQSVSESRLELQDME